DIAVEIAFYASTGLAPGPSLQLRALGLGNTLHRFQQFQATNFARLVSYLRDPAGTTALSGDDLATRGASWAFLRYAADRRGGSEAELWRRLIDSGEIGYANLASALGVSPLSWLHDWTVSLYTDDQVSSVEERFRQPSWDFRSIVPTFGTTGGAYPLQVEGLGAISGDRVSTVLSASGAAILRFNLVPGSRTELLTTSGGAEPPPALRLSLVRIR